MKRILMTLVGIATILGLIDAITSLSDHISRKTVNAGEVDVKSVVQATDLFVNEGGILETPSNNSNHNKFTPVKNIAPVEKQIHVCKCTREGNVCKCSINGYNCGCLLANRNLNLNLNTANSCDINGNCCTENSCQPGMDCNNCCKTVTRNRTVTRTYYAANPRGLYYGARGVCRGVCRVGQRIGYRVLHPFNGRFRRCGRCR